MTEYIKIAHIQTKDEQIQASLEAAVKVAPGMATIHRSIYEQMIKEGYTDEQSFKFSTDFILELIRGNMNDSSK